MKFFTPYYQLEYKEAAVRRVCSGSIEIIRMVYGAVRDSNWNTLQPDILEKKATQRETGFEINTLVRYKKNTIHFEAEYEITGNNNSLSFEMKGKAHSGFQTCRTGICVLHPVKECMGKKYRLIHTNGEQETGCFPKEILPVVCKKNIKQLQWKPADDVEAILHFSGDVFEMEDQRNWTDASYKTYSRPLEWPFPYLLKKGDQVHQKIVLNIKTKRNSKTVHNKLILKINAKRKYRLPELGTCVSSGTKRLTTKKALLLNKLPFRHLRYEVKFDEKNWELYLYSAIQEAAMTGWSMFLVLYLSADFIKEIAQLKKVFIQKEITVGQVLIVGLDHLPADAILDQVYDPLKSIFKGAKIGSGVNAYFAELNRNRPHSGKSEFISFSICPQVHAFDRETLIENLEGQRYVVESAKRLFPDKAIYVSPVTLKQRFNFVATSTDETKTPCQLPFQVDKRQHTIFAAQWLMSSINYLTQAEAGLISYFETVGPKGILRNDDDLSVADSVKENISPVYDFLKELTGCQTIIHSEGNDPLQVGALVLQNNSRQKILLTNFSESNKEVEIKSSIKWKNERMLFGQNKIEKSGCNYLLPPHQIIVLEEE